MSMTKFYNAIVLKDEIKDLTQFIEKKFKKNMPRYIIYQNEVYRYDGKKYNKINKK